MRDKAHNILVKRVISPVSVADNTAQVGQIIDRLGFESLTYLINTGSIADVDATFAVLLQEGDQANLSDAATVANSDMVSQTSGVAPLTATVGNPPKSFWMASPLTAAPLPMVPINVAAPVNRLMEYSRDTPPTVSDANADPVVTGVPVGAAEVTPLGMSNPLSAEKSRVVPPRVTAPISVVELAAEFCRYRELLTESIEYCVVTVAFGVLLVYDVPSRVVVAPLMFGALTTTRPVF